MVIIIVAVLFGMALAMPTNLAQRRRDRRRQAALGLRAAPYTAAPMTNDSGASFMDEDAAQFAQHRARIITRARESQAWKEARAYVHEKFHGAERRQLTQDLVREETAFAERIVRDQKVLIRDPKFRKDLATLLQYTAMSGRWDEARTHIRKTYAGARQRVVLRALAQAEATAKTLGPSHKDESDTNEPEAHENAAPEVVGTFRQPDAP